MTTKPNDGGPACPQPDLSGYGMGPVEIDGRYQMQGMSLRDYFAAQVMMMSWRAFEGGYLASDGDLTAIDIAKHAYVIADAMLKAREETQS